MSSSRIINLASPIFDGDAANKAYVDSNIKATSLAISLNGDGLTDMQLGTDWLSYIFPAGEHNDGVVCRVVCTRSGAQSLKEYVLVSGTWTYNRDVI